MIDKNVNLRPFQGKLRSLGFKRTHNMRSTVNPDCQIYERAIPEKEVKVEVQLWGDGFHRVSYYHPNLFVPEKHRTEYGHMDTTPTGFKTVPEMINAIEYESNRWLARDKEEFAKRVEKYMKSSVGRRHEQQEQRAPRLH